MERDKNGKLKTKNPDQTFLSIQLFTSRFRSENVLSILNTSLSNKRKSVALDCMSSVENLFNMKCPEFCVDFESTVDVFFVSSSFV